MQDDKHVSARTYLDVRVGFDGLEQGLHCILDVVPRTMACVVCDKSHGILVLLAGRKVA
jgi:hypothetical protein